jgi:hypothetical protein
MFLALGVLFRLPDSQDALMSSPPTNGASSSPSELRWAGLAMRRKTSNGTIFDKR